MTPLQHRCLEAIKRLTIDGVTPNYQMIMDDLGLPGKASVHRLVHALRDQGVIDFLPGRARTIKVVDSGLQGLALDKIAKVALKVHQTHHKPSLRDFRTAIYYAVTK